MAYLAYLFFMQLFSVRGEQTDRCDNFFFFFVVYFSMSETIVENTINRYQVRGRLFNSHHRYNIVHAVFRYVREKRKL